MTEPASEPPAGPRLRRWMGIGLGAAIVAAVVAVLIWRSDGRAGYDDAVREQFLVACTTDGGEPVRDTCECLYGRIEQTVPFDRFEEVDEMLAADVRSTPSGAALHLPDDVDALLQACIAETGS